MEEFIQEHIYLISIISLFILMSVILHIKQEKIHLKSTKSNDTKTIPCIYSWSTVACLFITPISRKDFKGFLLLLSIMVLTFGLGVFLFALFYNRSYIINLVNKGYIASDPRSNELLFTRVFKF